ncbi:MAG: glycosyltransferase family 2 protein [Niabella sp.]|nr:glycosyltransferase family 2 protein [Niabella sp.]
MNWVIDIVQILALGVFIYSLLLFAFYVFIGVISIGETNKYMHQNEVTDYRVIASSVHAPSVTIIAPAYNEGLTIIDNVRSLLSIYYYNLEVIIVNDGSKDDSLQQLIDTYQLEKTEFFIPHQIPTKPVKGVYKSRSSVFRKLVVIDKENGGKADALNVGINMASNDYVICIDVDCILEQDAILKMVKPFMEGVSERVIASGGVIRIANSSVVQNGSLVKVRLPKEYLPRMQTLEYIRAFLLGRMAWSRLNGLLLISGAFGAFDKEIVIACGGYSSKTVGEDMELVVRMRRYMEERKEPYKVTYIPDPLCWTEAPTSYKVLGRQRNRWIRGTYETLKLHRKMFFNPRYGLLGMLSYPYWFFFEMMGPIIEFFGFMTFVIMVFAGFVDWEIFLPLLAVIVSFNYLYSVFAIYMEVKTYNQYKRKTDVTKLLLTSLSEPFNFHPFIVWSSMKGFLNVVRKRHTWGDMVREGFEKTIS